MDAHGNKFRRAWEWAGLAVAAVTLLAFRAHAFAVPLETDECNYLYIAGRLLAGDRLYLDIWDHQPFGVFALFAAVIALFGDAPLVFRWLAVAFSLASLFFVYAIVRRHAGRPAGVGAALLFAITCSDPGTAGEGGNREIFMNTLILAAWWALTMPAPQNRPFDRPPGTAILIAGLLLGLGSTIKTVLAVHWAFLCAWLVWMIHRNTTAERIKAQRMTGDAPERRASTRPLAGAARAQCRGIALFAAGPLLIWTGACCWFAATDRFDLFYDAVIRFNLGYSAHSDPWWHRFARFFAPERHPFIFDSALPLWIAAIPALLWLGFLAARRKSFAAGHALALLIAGYFAVCLPGHFWPHYYHLMIPAMVVVVAVAAGTVPVETTRRNRTTALALSMILAATLFTENRAYLAQPPFGITVHRYNSRDFWGKAMGEKVGAVTEPDDSVFVYGNEAEIYYYSKRRCASRYTMCTGLKSGYPGAAERRKLLLDDLRRDPPRVILVLFDIEPFPEWHAFLAEHYGMAVGWDCHDRHSATCATSNPEHVIMLVYTRRAHPVKEIDWSWDRSEVGGWLP